MSARDVPVSKMARRAGWLVSRRLLGALLRALRACAMSAHSERSIGHDSRLHFSRRERETETLIGGTGLGVGGTVGNRVGAVGWGLWWIA